jgi:hypothetical protein
MANGVDTGHGCEYDAEQIKQSLESASAEVRSWPPGKEAGARATFDPTPLASFYESARTYVMSDEEREEQRRSFAHGNVALHNPAVTREVIDRAADETSSLRVENAGLYQGLKFVEYKLKKLVKLVEAADYLQHCRRREIQATAMGRSDSAKKSVERASEQYDFLRGQVKL